MGTRHTVQQGECLTAIAARYGFATIDPIWNATENKAFKQQRGNPDVILPGDEVFIPDRRPKTLSLATGQRHKIVVKVPLKTVRLKLDLPGTKLAGEAFELAVDGKKISGSVDSDGVVEAKVRANATQATLVLKNQRKKFVDNDLTKKGLHLGIWKLNELVPGGFAPAAFSSNAGAVSIDQPPRFIHWG